MYVERIVILAAILALALAPPAAALPGVQSFDVHTPEAGGDDSASRSSCAVTASDGPGSGVEPFVDTGALGVRVATPVGSYTVALYPYSCSSVVLQIADPDDDVPRGGGFLPEDMPGRDLLEPVLP